MIQSGKVCHGNSAAQVGRLPDEQFINSRLEYFTRLRQQQQQLQGAAKGRLLYIYRYMEHDQ